MKKIGGSGYNGNLKELFGNLFLTMNTPTTVSMAKTARLMEIY